MKPVPTNQPIPACNNRLSRRIIATRVEHGEASHEEMHRVQEIGREGFPWLEFKKVINKLMKKVRSE